MLLLSSEVLNAFYTRRLSYRHNIEAPVDYHHRTDGKQNLWHNYLMKSRKAVERRVVSRRYKPGDEYRIRWMNGAQRSIRCTTFIEAIGHP